MSLRLYMDVHIKRAITEGLRMRGVDVLTAQEDGARELPDEALMDRATYLGWVLFSHDQDMLAEASRRQRTGTAFSGLIYVHPLRLGIGACIRELELLARLCEPHELSGRVLHLPL